ncbi:alanine racemase [Glaciecola sp. 1036]|uniref:alanine racemase n=1 Tax=Alteromonadaceae TaxID=72275 RepID=UPI003D01A7E7
MQKTFSDLITPCLVVHKQKMLNNIRSLYSHCADLNVNIRPHVKTAKSIDVLHHMTQSPMSGVTVSTLKEAQYFFQQGVSDILYAVTLAPNKIDAALSLAKEHPDFKLLVDSLVVVEQIAIIAKQKDVVAKILIEIDVDGHRAGLIPSDSDIIQIANFCHAHENFEFLGLMTHAGDSYLCSSMTEVELHAQQEVDEMMKAVDALNKENISCQIISVGSTPTAYGLKTPKGITEIRAGVFVFQDLVMKNIGVCNIEDIALMVLTTVISHKKSHNRLIIDAGALAMSKDAGTKEQKVSYGYGLVLDAQSMQPMDNLIVNKVNQEHGIIQLKSAQDFARFPIGTQLLILPNHACMTAAAYEEYKVLNDGQIEATWPRVNGW